MISDGSVVVGCADGPKVASSFTLLYTVLSWTSWMFQESQPHQHAVLLKPAKCWLSVTAVPSNPTWSLSSRSFEAKFRL